MAVRPYEPRHTDRGDDEEDEDSGPEDFATTKRLTVNDSARARRRRAESSSSSEDESNDEEETRARRPRLDSSSSSDDDDEADQRRRRILKKRKDNEDQHKQELADTKGTEPAMEAFAPITSRLKRSSSTSSASSSSSSNSEISASAQKPLNPALPSSSSSSDDSSSDDSDSDSSSSASEHKIAPQLSKPVFIPRHQRSSVQQQQAECQKKEEKEVEDRNKAQKRKQESRAMVQQVLAASAQAAPDWSDAFEGITSARNAIPDDKDDNDDFKARDAWEVRELVRIIEDWDREMERLAEEKEIARRRKMTDEERMQEDIAAGRYQKPGEHRAAQNDGPTSKRYFHKGAFYMDEDEFEDDDVRRKAEEYARAATGSDKVNSKLLPKVMQVKKFGFANQSKYKGLAAEDTTDRHAEMLPLKRKK